MTKIDADELFRISKRNSYIPGVPTVSGLSNRTLGCLRRASVFGSADYFDAVTDEIFPDNIERDVRNGNIWAVRQIGTKTVREICDWLISLKHAEGER